MFKEQNNTDVGEIDPSKRTSPIHEGDFQERSEAETKQAMNVCYFNGNAYSHGISILQGVNSYYCNNGVWVKNQSHGTHSGGLF